MNPLRKHLTTPLRQWLTDQREVRRGQRELAAYGQAYYGFWDLGPMEQRWFYRFLQRPAFAGLPQQTRLHFFSVFCRRRLLDMVDQSTPKVFFTGENLAHYPAWSDHALGEVDLALGFARLKTDNYLRFPLWLLDIFLPDATLTTIEQRLAKFNAASRNFALRKRYAALIARHNNNGLRGAIADLLDDYGQVDFPGAFRNNQPTTLGPGYPAKLALLQQYRFNICPENSEADGYVTEKVWHAIAAGCIPVYWGSGNAPEPDILNPAAMLTFNPADPDHLANHLAALCANPAKAITFAQQNRFLPSAATAIHQFFLDLESALLTLV